MPLDTRMFSVNVRVLTVRCEQAQVVQMVNDTATRSTAAWMTVVAYGNANQMHRMKWDK